MRIRSVLFPVALCASIVTQAEAQRASQYIPLEHWSMAHIEHLIRSGVIADPAPLTRPLRRAAVLRELSEADTIGLSQATQTTIAQLIEHLSPPSAEAHARVEAYVGASWGTHARRDPRRAAGDGLFSPNLGLVLEGTWGHFVASSHAMGEKRLRNDPDYTGSKDPPIPGRFTDSYLSYQSRFFEATYGATSRNWGPVGLSGTLVSPEPYSYDHLFVRIGNDRLKMEALLTELDFIRNTAGDRVRRHWITHRVLLRPTEWLAWTLEQGTLLTGVGRGFDLGFMNPMKLNTLTRQDQDAVRDSINVLYGSSLWLRLPGGTVLQGNILLDDLASLIGSSSAPDRVAFTGSIETPAGHNASLRAYATLVSSLTYRSDAGPDQTVALRGVGLGRNFTDYWEAGVELSTFPAPGILVTPHISVLRQGEGDFRSPFPALPATDHPFLFEGVVETRWRVGVRADLARGGRLELSGDAGVHFLRNFQHEQNTMKSAFEGRVLFRYSLSRSISVAD